MATCWLSRKFVHYVKLHSASCIQCIFFKIISSNPYWNRGNACSTIYKHHVFLSASLWPVLHRLDYSTFYGTVRHLYSESSPRNINACKKYMTQPVLLQNTWKMLHWSTINTLYCTCTTWLHVENLTSCKLINLLKFLIAFMKDLPQLNYPTLGDSWKFLWLQIWFISRDIRLQYATRFDITFVNAEFFE